MAEREGIERLDQAIDQLLADAEQAGQVVSASRVINPLLAIWGLAHDLDPMVAIPVEQLLIVLTGRKLSTPTELARTMDEVRQALAGSEQLSRV